MQNYEKKSPFQKNVVILQSLILFPKRKLTNIEIRWV